MEETNKKELYEQLLSLIKDYLKDAKKKHLETIEAELLNYLKSNFSYMDWVGFYLLDEEDSELYLGFYLGKEACELISLDKGVCGKAAREKRSQLIDDVSRIAYHIACSSSTRSELVIPFLDKKGKLLGVLDLDSDELSSFSKTDDQYLQSVLYLISKGL